MIKDIIQRNENLTPNSHTLEVLKAHFPQCFNKEGIFDLDKFKDLIKADVDITHEGYDLNFLGRNYAKLLASIDTTTVIQPDLEHNAKPENANSQNLYISGDNLDGLKHLLKSYTGEIKCIYIDPPYNTGTDGFVYNDRFNFTPEELVEKLSISEEQAQKIFELTTTGRASHSAWLTFMYPRLLLARDLLTPDGVIFISIDDNEQANVKLVCDSVFGEENFVSTMIWSAGRKNDSTFISNSHEFILCYLKNKEKLTQEKVIWRTKKIGLDDIYATVTRLQRVFPNDFEKQTNTLRQWYSELNDNEPAKRHSHYKCIDSVGVYFPSDISWPGGGGPKYEVLHPITKKACKIPERGWVFPTDARMKEKISEGLIHFGPDEQTVPCVKSYLKDNEFEVPYSVLYKDGRAATKRLNALLAEGVFTNPKDEEILSSIFQFTTDSNSIILDFFSGSASTAHAVILNNIFDLNNGGKGKRKYILIQLPEDLDEKYNLSSTDNKKKIKKAIDFLESCQLPHTLDCVGIERIKRISKKIKAETNSDIDYGFKHYTLLEPSPDTIDKLDEFNAEVMFANNDTLSLFGKESVLETWLVKDGYGFGAKADETKLADYTAYLCGKHLYFIEAGINENDMVALLDKYQQEPSFSPENIVVFGYSFNFSQTEMLRKNLFVMRDSHKNLKANFDIRY